MIHFINLVSEETPNEGDSSLEEVAIIKQKRKFDAIQDEASAAEENVAKKIKFEEWVGSDQSSFEAPRFFVQTFCMYRYIVIRL